MLKIDCLENKINGQLFYTGFITFKDLSERSQLKPLTVNRLINEKRIGKMHEFIKNQEAFYPPIVLALDDRIEFKYDINHKVLQIELSKEEKPLVIIDGQHRYKSIDKLVSENKESQLITDRRQAVFIITTMNEAQQRDIFMDINDNMQKVSSVSKLISSIDITNYLSLKTVKDLGIVKKINFKSDQCTVDYPYKYIIEGNRKLFGEFDIEKFKHKEFISKLEILNKISNIVWNKLLKFIEDNSKLNIWIENSNENKKNFKFFKTEVFTNAFLLCFIEKYNYDNFLKVEKMDEIEITSLEKNVNEFIDELKKKNFDTIEESLEGLNKKDRQDKLLKIIGGEDNE